MSIYKEITYKNIAHCTNSKDLPILHVESQKSTSAIRDKMNMRPYEHKFQRAKFFRFVL